MNNGVILIVEDERDWQDRHRLYLQDRGYQTKVVNTGAAAIQAVETDRNELIQFVVVDHLLMDPDLKAQGIQALSSLSGKDVIKKLRAIPRQHPLRIAMITGSAAKKAKEVATNLEETLKAYDREYAALQREVGNDTKLLAKYSFEDEETRDEAYKQLVEFFLERRETNVTDKSVRRLLVGLGFDGGLFGRLLAGAGIKGDAAKPFLHNRQVLPLADFVARLHTDASEDELPELCAEVLNGLLTGNGDRTTWEPGDGHIPKVGSIIDRGVTVQLGIAGTPEPDWKQVQGWNPLPPAEMQILDVLAFHAEAAIITGTPASREFDPRHYNGTDRAVKDEELGVLAEQVGAAPVREVQGKDFLSGGGENALPGAHLTARRRSAHAARVARILTPLRKKLSDRESGEGTAELRLGLGRRESVIRHVPQTDTYYADFETRLVLYVAEARKKGGRPKSANPKKPR